MLLKLILTALLLASGYRAFSQAAPDATHGGSKLVLGVGFSDFYTDWNGRLVGATAWADWNLNRGPGFLSGLGVEVEGRDLNYGCTCGGQKLRQDTAAGGPTYTMRHHRKFQPYGKFLVGIGSFDFGHLNPTYSHDTRTVFAPGAASVIVRGETSGFAAITNTNSGRTLSIITHSTPAALRSASATTSVARM